MTQCELFLLLRLNLGVPGEHLSHISWIAASLLFACACLVYLVDELIFICSVPLPLSHSGASAGSFGVFQEQNYVALLPENTMSAGFHYRNWKLGI